MKGDTVVELGTSSNSILLRPGIEEVEETSKIGIKNLDLYHGDFKALKDVNLEIEAT